MKKRVISLLLCLVLVLCVFLVPSAPPARAITGIDDALLFFFLATVVGAGAGMAMSYEGMSQSQAASAYADQFDAWQASSSGSGSSLSSWLSDIGVTDQSVQIVNNGGGLLSVILDNFIVAGLKGFWDWFNVDVLGASDATAADGVHAGVGANFAEVGFYLGGYSVYDGIGTATGYSNPVSSFTGSSDLYLIAVPSGSETQCVVIWFSRSHGSITFGEGGTTVNLSLSGDWYSYGVRINTSRVLLPVQQIPGVASVQSFMTWLNNTDGVFTPYGATAGYRDGLEAMTYPQDLEDENVETIPYVTNVPAEGVGEETGTGAIPLVDGIPSILDSAIDGFFAVEEEAEENPDTPARPITSPGLASVFPFCLPFDVYHFFQCLSAAPVAPHFEWEMQIPGIIDYTWVIDLSGFNTVAQILRTVELLAFCVGLAFVTRSMFIRG